MIDFGGPMPRDDIAVLVLHVPVGGDIAGNAG